MAEGIVDNGHKNSNDNIVSLILKAGLLLSPDATAKLATLLPPSGLWTVKMGMIAFYAGAGLGCWRGASKAALVFLAENAHRLPKTKGGWFMYHKQKNYTIMRSFIHSGLQTGARWGLGASIFCLLEWGGEEVLGVIPSARDNAFVDTLRQLVPATFAGLSSGLLFSVYHRLWISQSKRAVALSTSAGLGISLLQLLHTQIYNRSIKQFTPFDKM